MENPVFPYLEWEVLREPITISNVDDRMELPKGQKKIVVNRDDDYNLTARLHFKDPDFYKLMRQQSAEPGSFAETFDIHGSYYDHLHCTLESSLIKATKITYHQESHEILGTAHLHFKALRISYQHEKEGTHLTEWYLNGPEDSVFRRVTDRKLSKAFLRMRMASKEDKIDSLEVSGDSSTVGRDFLRVRTGEFQFLITRVPNGIGPEWSSNTGIEYRNEWDRIPNVHEREEIEELCSFVFGRQLLKVGYTMYDQNEKIVEAYAHDPWGKAAKSYCSKPEKPPIRIDDFGVNAEDIISRLLPAYHEMRDPLHLKEALWQYWTSRQMPIGTDLPVLAASVESIINGWYKHPKSKSHGVYIKKNEFESLLKEELEAINRKLEKRPAGAKISAKLLRSYEFGLTERFRVFFEEIDLPIEVHEWQAIKERHKFAHGGAIFDETDWKQMIQHVDTLETILHKILLKLLGYLGPYIDRGVLGWKDKQLS